MSADDIFEQMHELVHAYKAQMRDVLDAAAGVSPMAARALAHIVRHPGCTPGDLVAHSGRDKAQIARLLKDLEEAHYITRAPDPGDRRSYTLQLTERGRALHKKMHGQRRRAAQALTRGIADDELAQLSALLHRLLANAERPVE